MGELGRFQSVTFPRKNNCKNNCKNNLLDNKPRYGVETLLVWKKFFLRVYSFTFH